MIFRFLLLICCSIFISRKSIYALSISKEENCQLRCIASCVAFVNKDTQANQTRLSREECTSKCAHFNDPKLCSNGHPHPLPDPRNGPTHPDADCWSTCNNQMEAEKTLPATTNVILTPSEDGLTWNNVPGAVMYIVSYRTSEESSFSPGQYVIADSNHIKRPYPDNIDTCSSLDVTVVAFSEDGIGVPSAVKTIPPPKPSASPMLKLVTVQYVDKKFTSDFYEANGTIDIVFEYNANPWPLGDADLELTPLFHLITCSEPDLSQGIPVPEFRKGSTNSTIIASLGSDMMYRQCKYVYYLQSVSSKKCGTMTEMQSPPANTIQTIVIQCDKVKDAPCVIPVVYERPVCGQIKELRYQPTIKKIDYNDVTTNVTVNVTFVPLLRPNEVKTLYYIGIYGEAKTYPDKEEEMFLGVNITRVEGMSSSCLEMTPSGDCAATSYNNSLTITNIHPKKMYGLTICAIKDPRNLTLPSVTGVSKSDKPKAFKIELVEEIPSPITITANNITGIELVDDENWIRMKREASENVIIYPENMTINSTDIEEGSGLNITTEQDYVFVSNITEYDTNSTSDSNSTEETLIFDNFTISTDPPIVTVKDDPPVLVSPEPKVTTPDYSRHTEYQQHSPSAGMIIGIVLGIVAVLIILVSACLYYLKKKHRKNEKLYKLKIAQINRENQNRYIDFPAAIKHDVWEIERRNLIIHMDKKLGSGAFGAVYLGKMIGKSLGHKDANSPLGVNLMRTENCEVAVKMLPEYADDMSKSEFLREIGLMKTLGYHERLVNMLACVTDSEPLCLVVEYCSDGDLLQHLRQRCKYMMKLDDLKINYHDPPTNNSYDPDMIITIKQLLQYAVQISYGLEYLSHKGFVHRDVAARNILVHDGNTCKIGDFGLCRYIYADQSQYKSKGGRLPLKWMSPEAIRHYEFSIKSDVWSFGILLFEIITLGGSPYPGMPPEDVLPFLESGGRIDQPDNCPDNFYEVMKECWHADPEDRVEFSDVRMKLATQLEDITEDYSYLKLDAAKDYYNVQYGEEGKKEDVIIIPDGASITLDRKPSIIDIKQTDSMETVETIA